MNTQLIPLTIGDIAIRQDDEGRYCVNDLHRASGGAQKDKPVHWLKTDRTKSLISLLSENPTSEKINNLEPVKTVNSFTEEQGTFVCRELVYDYAMWISPAFHIKVIRTYDAVIMDQIETYRWERFNRPDLVEMVKPGRVGRYSRPTLPGYLQWKVSVRATTVGVGKIKPSKEGLLSLRNSSWALIS